MKGKDKQGILHSVRFALAQRGNLAISNSLRDPWLSVPASRRVWHMIQYY
jgi:hypothetical protein